MGKKSNYKFRYAPFPPIFCFVQILGIALLCFLSIEGKSQSSLSNLHENKVPAQQDSFRLDTTSLVPNSIKVFAGNQQVNPSHYRIDAPKGMFYWTRKPQNVNKDSFTLVFRKFPVNFKETYQHKEKNTIDTSPVSYREKARKYKKDPRKKSGDETFGSLERNGSITRGIRFGNNQDLSLNSNLDLQITGQLTEDIDLQASITDQNLPIEPEGNTAQLQDFDKVKIELTTANEKLTLGDYQMKPYKDDYFMSYFKKTQGISFQRTWETKDGGKANAGTDFGFSRGKFARNTFNGNEGDQGPYQLRGNNGEIYIVIVAGTERVFLNGKKLERGEQADYTIDYNSGEISFTQEHIISQNDRIVVEFQYAKRNYERSILHSYGKYENDRYSIRANIFSEQDHKKSPIFQELSDEDEALMSKVGDSTHKAVRESYERQPFSEDRILYRRIDTMGFEDVFVHTTSDEGTTYEVSFSNVGPGNGNYVKARTKANGQVFQWVQPQNGQSRGRYEPVKQLVTPKKQQMATLGGDFNFGENGKVGLELAMSNKDVNTFSDKNDQDDKDVAGKAFVENTFNLTDQEHPWQIESRASLEIKNAGFEPIERYRPVEFERTWNRRLANPTKKINKDEELGKLDLTLKKEGFLQADYNLSHLNREDQFRGWLHETGLEMDLGKYDLNLQNDFTNIKAASPNESLNNKNFLHQRAGVSREMAFVKAGINYEREVNQHLQKANSTLDSQSFRYEEWQAYLKSPDTARERYSLKFTQRWNYTPTNKDFIQGTKSDIYAGKVKLHKSQNHDLDFSAQYRKFKVINEEIQNQESKNSAVGNLEWDWNGLEEVIENKTFYQIGSGKEQKTEYQYIKVRGDGRGNYVWEDYNDNGVQEIDEFQRATDNNDFRANYIRVVTPTNEFISTVSNEFRENLKIMPSKVFRGDEGLKGFLGKFRNETTFSIHQKVFDRQTIEQYNPFDQAISDTNLVTTNSRIKNIFYFNKTHPTFGVNVRYNENEGKNLLSNGFTTHTRKEKAINLRWNISKTWSLHPEYQNGHETSQSELLTNQNYQIHYNKYQSELNYQPSGKFQTALIYAYENYENREEGQDEKSDHHRVSTQLRYNWVGKGNINATINYTDIAFSGQKNSAGAYQILKGLNVGNNLTWRLRMNYQLGENLQLSLQYNGRDSENQQTIHQSNVNIRYLF